MKPTTIPITIAGITIAFTLRSKGITQAVERRYRGYIFPEELKRNPQLLVEVKFTRGFFEFPQETVLMGGQGEQYTIDRRDFTCQWQGNEGSAHLHESIYAFDACLRIILATLIVHHKGLLLHSSSIALGKKAYIFSGKSDAGKTTISRLSGKKVLNDEIVAVKISKTGKINVYGTPFWGEMGTGPVYNSPYELMGIYFLNQSLQVKRDPINALQGISPLLQVVCYFDKKPENVDRLMGLCMEMVSITPLFQLYFDKSDAFLKVL